MKHRPKWLVILAALHILEPFTKIGFLSLVHGVSPLAIISAQMSTGTILHNIGFFFLFPVMGLAMLSLNKWVLVLLVLSELWVIVANLAILPALIKAGDVNQMISLGIFTTINVAVIVMLMIPISKLALTDRRVQWWKTFPRYRLRGKIKFNGSIAGNIHSVSESGIFVTVGGVDLDQKVNMAFSYDNRPYKLNGIVRSYIKKGAIEGCGIEFSDNNSDDVKAIKSLIKTLKEQGAPRSAAQKTVALKLPFPNNEADKGGQEDPPSSFHIQDMQETQISFKKFK